MLCKPDFAATALPTPKESLDLSSLWFEELSVLTMLCRTWTNGSLLVNWPNSGCFLLSSFSMLLPCRQWTVGLCWFSATYLCHWKSRSWATWRHARATHVQGIARHVGTSFELLPSLYWHRCIDASSWRQLKAMHNMGRSYVMTDRPQGGEMYDICRS